MLELERRMKIIRYLNGIRFNSSKINMTDTIVVAGSPRSGTTWLMEILETIPGYTNLFEPLNPTWFPKSFEVGFQSRTYLPINADWSKGEDYLKKAFTGHIISIPPPPKLEMIMHRLLADKLIVKSINLNRLLPWISKKFRLRQIFFIIRHPCAVVASQLKTGICGYFSSSEPYKYIFPTLKNILEEASEISELDHYVFNRLKSIETKEEILTAAWCLDNYVPLSSQKPHPWKIVIYEKLVKNGEKEIRYLFDTIREKNIPRSATRHLKILSNSAIKGRNEVLKSKYEKLTEWKRTLSGRQVERILKLVSNFGLDFYTGDIEPDYEHICV